MNRSTTHEVPVEIGGLPVRLLTTDPEFLALIEDRYAGFINRDAHTDCVLEVETSAPTGVGPDDDVQVRRENGIWRIQRGDFLAEWNPATRSGRVRQTANPYAIDSLLRIIHTLLLAGEGGFLLHSSSAVRNGRAFLFSGLSGAGKTTISRLAPPDATLLTDEVSYLRRQENGYRAFGTPFAGELATPGDNVSAPVAALYFLAKGAENKIEPIGQADAIRGLMGNILFFAEDPEMVKQVFQSALDFLAAVPAHRLTFLPDERVWEIIG